MENEIGALVIVCVTITCGIAFILLPFSVMYIAGKQKKILKAIEKTNAILLHHLSGQDGS